MSDFVSRSIRNIAAVTAFVGLMALGMVFGATVADEPSPAIAQDNGDGCAEMACEFFTRWKFVNACVDEPDGGSDCGIEGSSQDCVTFDCEY